MLIESENTMERIIEDDLAQRLSTMAAHYNTKGASKKYLY